MAKYGCGRCRREFGNLTIFDLHHDVDYGRRPPVECKDPADLGLVKDKHDVWQTPEGLAARERATQNLRRNRD